jgi:hypothetical protein
MDYNEMMLHYDDDRSDVKRMYQFGLVTSSKPKIGIIAANNGLKEITQLNRDADRGNNNHDTSFNIKGIVYYYY